MPNVSVATRKATARPWHIQKGLIDATDQPTWLVVAAARHNEAGRLLNEGHIVAACYGPDAAANARLIVLALGAYEEKP